ncbi:hypothetical protein GYA25_00100 [Candidatus Woesearchaeota archaeon]|nr:hypothetical protein [Candidatus Woesearchaeota archaeon]
MGKEDPLYLKIDYKNALISKKEILTLELLFLKMNQIRKKYHVLRLKDFEIKEKLQKSINQIKKDLEKISDYLPEFKIPKDIQRKRKIRVEEQIKEEKISYNKGLDIQLMEIQNKLNNLEEKLNMLRD